MLKNTIQTQVYINTVTKHDSIKFKRGNFVVRFD